MQTSNQKGNVLLFTILAMTVFSVLGAGIYFLTTTSTFSGLEANAQQRAYQLAVAGRDYALANNLPNMDRSFTMAGGDKFHLVIAGDQITSTGIVNEGTPYEAKAKVTALVPGFGSRADISFAKDVGSFSPTATAQAGFIGVDQAAAQISLGQLQASLFGSIWYGGDTATGNCQNGKCDFGKGFRTYFLFRLTRQGTESPHGFTFAVFNGTDNSNLSSGGDWGLPELLAYGGNSCTSRNAVTPYNCYSYLAADATKRGIHPPKFAVEFDGRQNCCDSETCTPFPAICKTNVCNTDVNSNSRADGPQAHMAYVFWGDHSAAAECSTKDNSRSYDDNRHGAGAGDDPVNAVSTDAADTEDYFIGSAPSWNADWLYNTTKVYAVRMEVERKLSANVNGKYDYTINTWIRRCNSENVGDPAACAEFPGLSNTRVAYEDRLDYDPVTDAPTLTRKIELTPAFHTKFDKFLFGWTAAAGSITQENVTLGNFQLYFHR